MSKYRTRRHVDQPDGGAVEASSGDTIRVVDYLGLNGYRPSAQQVGDPQAWSYDSIAG
jgi:hypothetical protein